MTEEPMNPKPCQLAKPTLMYERLIPWPGDDAPRCIGGEAVVPAWAPAEVVRVSARDPARALVRARYGGKDYFAWMRESAQFEAV
jgi:hypothetical protein